MTPEKTGPQSAGTDAAQGSLFTHDDNRSVGELEGERRKLDALATLAARNPDRVRAAQTVLLRLLLDGDGGPITINAVRIGLGIPDSSPSRWLGCVPAELSRAGIIRRAAWVTTGRAKGHARPISSWELVSAEAAREWLRTNAPDAADAGTGA